MAYESYYWRAVITRELKYIDKKMQLSHKNIEERVEEEYSKLEVKIMTLAYVARKLADSGKLPDSTLHKHVQVVKYPRTNRPSRGFVDIETEYDFDNPSPKTLAMRNVCNQIIHSYTLQTLGSSRKAFKSFVFVSARDKNKAIYELKLKDFISMMEHVRSSHVVEIKAVYDSAEDEWRYTRS